MRPIFFFLFLISTSIPGFAETREELIARASAATVVISRGDRTPCTGVFVEPRVVLSAAHCLWQSGMHLTNLKNVPQFFGDYSKKPESAVDIDYREKHDSWRGWDKNFSYSEPELIDIGVAIAKTEILKGQKYEPIPILDRRSYQALEGDELISIAYGTLPYTTALDDRGYEKRVMIRNVPLDNNQKIVSVPVKRQKIIDQRLQVRLELISGDSGSPLFLLRGGKIFLLAIASNSGGAFVPNSIYTFASDALPWLQNQIGLYNIANQKQSENRKEPPSPIQLSNSLQAIPWTQ